MTDTPAATIARLHAAMAQVADGDVTAIKALYAHTADALHEGCEDAAIIIDQTRGWRPPCGEPLQVISTRLLRREGAIALSLKGDAINWTSVERQRGVRPWTARRALRQ